ncbi:type II toxin-antitoxin system RelE/ParE family toxin [uncultured Methylobacterium sp.]|uniref:type II toxin-antitoxin system RelE/ParE family toxin n=1 Tax=uncultured Methylobacterium sp. TaxID=157278 RepID=UPI0035CB87BB
MRRLVYRPAAIEDLDGIYDLIAADDPQRARAFIDGIRERCRKLCVHPELGPARADLRPGIRIFPIRRRVVVAYRIEADAIVVVRITYGGRDYEALIQDDGDRP